MTDEAMSPLRRRMIEDMTIRKLSPKTQQGYIRTIKNLAAFLGRSPDKASFEDVRRFQPHVARFFFRVTLRGSVIIEHTAFHPRASQAAGGAESGGGCALSGGGTGHQVQGGAE